MGTWTTTPRTWVAGEVVTASQFNANLRDLGRGFTDAWTAYTPTLTASTTNPTGWTQTGYYMQVGKLVIAKFQLVAGASVTAGSGSYRVALPVNANTTSMATCSASVYIYDATPGALVVTPYVQLSSTYFDIRYPSAWPSGNVVLVAHNVPYTWANGDTISGQITYEAA